MQCAYFHNLRSEGQCVRVRVRNALNNCFDSRVWIIVKTARSIEGGCALALLDNDCLKLRCQTHVHCLLKSYTRPIYCQQPAHLLTVLAHYKVMAETLILIYCFIDAPSSLSEYVRATQW